MGFVAASFGIPAAMETVAVMQLVAAGLFAVRVPARRCEPKYSE